MDLNEFKAGRLIKVQDFKAFQPEKINLFYSWADAELSLLLEKATLKLGELSAFSELVPNIDHFIKMHVIKEATLSSRIEGTQTNMEEAMLREQDLQPEKRNDWREVNNYILAMNESINQLQRLPLSSRLLKNAHEILMQGVRGENKQPGLFRKSQNWIGGASINDAAFVPPLWQEVNPLMGDLENLLHNDASGLPQVMRIALAHYQFETIHPFLDGNGRIGRLMITLYFVSNGILKKPVLYLSAFLEKNKSLYYDHLTRVRTNNDLKQWLKFFLVGITETSEQSVTGLKKIIALKAECEEKRIYKLNKKIKNAKILLDHLFEQPIVTVEDVSRTTSLSLVSSYALIDDFVKLKILHEMTGFKRNRMFVFEEYFKIFNS
jgi:Fic family protein